MAKEVVGLEINVTGNANASVKTFREEIVLAKKEMDDTVKKFGELSPEAVEAARKVKTLSDQFTPLRSQLREANNNLGLIVDKFGVGSREAAKAAREVARLRDNIGDAKSLSDAFNPDRKFAALSGVISGVAGGFAALQGAIGLTGAKSEDLEKQLLKVQSALALSQGINSVLEMKDSFIVLTNVIKTSVISAFTALRTAIGLTGIGALLLAVGVLAANFDRVKKAIVDTFPALGDMSGLLDRLMQIIKGVGNAAVEFLVAPFKAVGQAISGDFSGALDTLKNGLDFSKNYNKGVQDEITKQNASAAEERLANLIKSQEKELEVRKAGGKNTIALERQILNEKLQLYKDDAEKYAEVLQQKRVFEATVGKQQADEARKAKALRDAEEKKLAEEAFQKRLKDNEIDNLRIQKEQEEKRLQRDFVINNKIEVENALGNIQAQSEEQRRQTEFAYAEARIEIAQRERDAKFEIINQIANVSNAAADLVGRNTAVGKALAIATTTIDTYVGAQKAYIAGLTPLFPGDPSGPVRAALAATAAVVSGIARVKAIVAVKVPQGGSGGLSTPSIQSNASAPIGSNFSQAQSVSLDRNSINQLGDKSNIRAYVLDQDIKDQDRRNQRIERASVLGG